MSDHPRFVSAASFPLTAFAELFTRTFEGYAYPMMMTAPMLATRVRIEQLDLSHSVVMLHNDEPIGHALLGLRGTEAWCGGFGIARAFRGKSLAHPLGEALLEQARLAGATRLSLEVLTRNTAAVAVYQRLGLTIVRDMQIFEWTPDDAIASSDEADDNMVASADPHELLQQFAALHPVQPAWQRNLPALLVRSGLHGLRWTDNAGHAAYVLYSDRDTTARIEDLAATRLKDAIPLLRHLQGRYSKIMSVNEASDSPTSAAFGACNFREVDRQHEMAISLSP